MGADPRAAGGARDRRLGRAFAICGLFNDRQRAVVYFTDSVAGLSPGAAVTYRGVPIGSVKQVLVEVDARDLSVRVPVVLELSDRDVRWSGGSDAADRFDVDELVKAGLRARLGVDSIVTAQARVDLEFLPGTPAPRFATAADEPEIPAAPSRAQSLQRQLAEIDIKRLLDTAQATLASVYLLARRADARIDPLADDLH